MAASAIQIIDSHVHIWQPSRFHYHWLEAGSALYKDFHLTDLRAEMEPLDVVGGILIEATNTPAEISWLLELSAADSLIWGVIGWLHLDEPDALAQITHFAQHSSFKGVRLNWLAPRPNTSMLDNAMQAVSRNGLVVDVMARWEYLSDVATFIRHHPAVSFVLEHLGGAPLTEALLPGWRAQMQPFALLPNVAVKISGYAQPIAERTLHAYVQTALNLFGAHRLMFGSNYPLCLSIGDYSKTVITLQNAAADWDQTEQNALFYTTARRIYHLF